VDRRLFAIDGVVEVGERGVMAVTSIDIDPAVLTQAKQLAGTSPNREAVDLALRTLIAVRRQHSAVEQIISRRFEPDQIDVLNVAPNQAADPTVSTRPEHISASKNL